MNRKMIANTIGRLIILAGALMLVPLTVSVIYGEWKTMISFLITSAGAAAVGILVVFLTRRHSREIYAKEGFVIAALSWIVMSAIGALPFVISGDIPSYVDKAEFVVTVGFIKNPAIRIKLYNKVKEAGGKFATIIASTAHVSKYAEIGEGTVVLHQASVNAGARVGCNVILNTATNIEHDAVIGDHCHISTGTMVNGECIVGNRCFIGSQSVLANCITIGDDIIVGAGSLVRKSIKEKGIYSGNPAILKVKAKA